MSDTGAVSMDFKEYKLRCSLLGHTSDVRAVAVTGDGGLLTASRDKTARLWRPEEGTNLLNSVTEYRGHSGYVTSICFLTSNSLWQNGLTITGSRDATILVYLPSASSPLKELTGHTDTVSCLACKDGVLVSGSWDHTARVWSTADNSSSAFPCEAVLKSHGGPLWAVALLDNNQGILTAAADKTILHWKQFKVARKFSGHSDCVRALAVLSSSSFLSASNDATIRRWDLHSGLCMAVYYGHTNFVYTLSPLLSPGGIFVGFVSGSEDRTVRVWDDEGACVQTLNLPCQSAWSVAAMPSSDVAVGTSDGACRVYTRTPESAASEAEQQALAEHVAAAARPAAAEMGDLQPDKLPDRSALQQAGTKDGQTLMVREEGKVMCYSWSAGKRAWEAVGEVVGGTGGSTDSSGKVLYQGKEYDYVFNVELDEGVKLKLPYNNSDDPYMAAQGFIDVNQLPQDQLDQVANFIITNSKNAATAPAAQGYFDPFTGGSRYVPGGASNSGFSNGTGGSTDPFTSSGGYVPPSAGGQPTSHSSHYPQTTSLLFEACNAQGITAKFKENNKMVDASVSLTDAELEQLLSGIFGDVNNIRAESVGPLEKALQWSPEKVWPSLDLLRLCLRSRTVQQQWVTGSKGAGIVSLLTTFLQPPSTATTQLQALRCLANLSAHQEGCSQLTVTADTLLATVTDMAPYPNKNMEIAAATLLLNCAVLLRRKTKELSDLCQVLSGLCTLLVSCNEPEAQYRTLVGVGTVLINSTAECIQFAVSLDIRPLLDTLTHSSMPKVKECSSQLLELLPL